MAEKENLQRVLDQFRDRLDSVDEKLDSVLGHLQVLNHAFGELRSNLRIDSYATDISDPSRPRNEPPFRAEERLPAASPDYQPPPLRIDPTPPVQKPSSAASPAGGAPRVPRDIADAHRDASIVHWDDISSSFQEGGPADCLVFHDEGRYWMIPSGSYLDHPSYFHSRLSWAFRWTDPKRGPILVVTPAEVEPATGGRFTVRTQGEIGSAR